MWGDDSHHETIRNQCLGDIYHKFCLKNRAIPRWHNMVFEIRWRSINHNVKIQCEVLVDAYC